MTGWQAYVPGHRHITIPTESVPAVLSYIQHSRLSHKRIRRHADGAVSVKLSLHSAGRLIEWAEREGIFLEIGPVEGLAELLSRYRGRIGIPVGILLFAMVVWLSTTVVWSVEITGNERLSDEDVLAILEECGFGVGSRFGEIHFEEFHNRILLQTDEIAWIAINMFGTTARVEVREKLHRNPEHGEGVANLVAAEDGQIVEVHLSGGRAAVSPQDIVRKGELLASGIMVIRGDTLRYEHASGQVLAQVNRQIVTQVPLQQEVRIPTGEEYAKKTLIIFGKEIKLFQNAGIDTAFCDTIIESTQLSLPGGIDLPVYMQVETTKAYRTEVRTRTEAQAYEQARRQFHEAVKEMLLSAEVLSLESTAVIEEGVCSIIGDLVCLVDIAMTQEIPLQ